VNDLQIKLLNSIQFTFVLNFSEDLEVSHHHGMLAKFSDLFNRDKIISEICKKAPNMKHKLNHDKTTSYEAAEISAIETVRRLVKRSPFTFNNLFKFNKKKVG
jgi:uncharacterized protein (UPF0332 family)